MPQRNYDLIQTPGGKDIKAWIQGVPVEEEAKKQLMNMAKMPFIYGHIAVMPDVHLGKGATVGSVIPSKGTVIPAAVGVDIGCGMVAARTSLKAKDLPENLKEIRSQIEKRIPHGRTHNGGRGDRGAWNDVPKLQQEAWKTLEARFKKIVEKHPSFGSKQINHVNHLGTLGTGNHFVEVCLDQEDSVWVMLHSGSRGVGNRIGTYFIELAKQDMRKHAINLPDQDLAYLTEGTDYFEDYFFAVEWAQDFARLNRDLMLKAALLALSECRGIPPFVSSTEAVNCHHNYVSRETHFGEKLIVTRKGAVRARKGELGIIPGSMGARSFIVRGLGNPESFESCSHGAGRAMSRTQAKKQFTIQDHVAATQGVECRKDADVIDETPKAYKSIDAVMKAQSDLVEVVHTLKQIICVKG